MKYTTIRIEGAILSADILDKIEQGGIGGQLAKDFGFDTKTKVKDEIARAWADAQDLWRIFKRQKEKVAEQEYGTTETRKFWMIPLLGLLEYDAQLSKAETVHGKSYAVSHRTSNLDGFPVHIVGFNDSLDKKRTNSGPRMSPHALLQEYINLTEHLYTIVANGIHLRLLRDSSRLIKLSFIEFDLETMMEEEHYADFAIMYRLLHISRMPVKMDQGAESLIEKYHQDALDSGSRIREGLSNAVERSILSLANGFLEHAANEDLRKKIDNEEISASKFYQYQLRLIYRILFLMVIEERNLIFPHNADKNKRGIYYEYYSINRIRKLCEKQYLADKRFNDLWIVLKNTFHLFESESKGKHLGIKPLAGDLFGYDAIGILNNCNLDNKVLLGCLKNLSVFINKNTGQKMRINYASLNVEEFGSVYEGLLEYDPIFSKENGSYQFGFVKGTGRSASGSHYTPDELVQPLIKHSLDHIIKDRLNSSDQNSEEEKSLLSIKVCDVACGSGHILLNAARRIGTELAKVRTGEDQPSPAPLRQAIRDVIKSCIYGVDKNPLAVELCKVALWLEAHNPGEPLNFLDHHIKCGDAIVGLAHKEELENGIANEAFKKMPDDDKDIRAELAKRNKTERKSAEKRKIFYEHSEFGSIDRSFTDISKVFESFNRLPENSIKEIEDKRIEYQKLVSRDNWWRLKTLADIQVAQFFIPKTEGNAKKIITDDTYQAHLSGRKPLEGSVAVAKAMGVAAEKRFFHWFLEFPEVFTPSPAGEGRGEGKGGFDCILGNPPFLGGQRISGNYGSDYLNWLKAYYSITGSCDLVTYFFRRVYNVIKKNGFLSLISTNSISQGVAREGGLEVIINSNGSITFAVSSMKWPGVAAVEVSLVGVYKGKWNLACALDSKKVPFISSYLDDSKLTASPKVLHQNMSKCFMGSTVVGPGFILSNIEAQNLLENDYKYSDVIFPYLNGRDLNTSYDQLASRKIINLFDFTINDANKYRDCFNIVEQRVKPYRLEKNYSKKSTELWWQYYRPTIGLYKKTKDLKRVIVVAQVSKTIAFSFVDSKQVFDAKLIVFTLEEYRYFSVLQSNFHYNWAWKYCTTMKSDLSYGIERIFETYPFPQNLSEKDKDEIEIIGSEYHVDRQQLMYKIKLGLTKIYNLFHEKELSTDDVIKACKCSQDICEESYREIIKLREMQKQLDETVLKAYGWQDIDLAHDFYEVDYLPESDRVRYTISPDARKEVLKRLLKLNHEIHEQEVKAGLHIKGKAKKKQKADASEQMKLF
ncbi:MAG: N-6 DNA methylase [Deltaproteobacteria bacterium]|nr:N-6 DNA methylase [Deltaproteobacteria bacterium]